MKFAGKKTIRIGMGCWAIGGPFYAGDTPLGFAGADDVVSLNTVAAALDAGVTLFDTAAVYGAGHAERLLGQALKHRDDVIVVSKLGTAMDETRKQMLSKQTDPKDVLPAIEACLRRLDRDQLDVMLLHLNDLPSAVARPLFEEMEHAREQGKIGAYGWSTDFAERAQAMTDLAGFIAVEHASNVFMDVPSVTQMVEQTGLAALIRSPLAMGVLSGKYQAGDGLPPEDVRAQNSDVRDYFHDGQASKAYLDNLQAIGEVLRTDGRSLTQGALCWLLAKSERNIPIPGMRTPAQSIENASAAAFGPLPEAAMAEIEALIDRAPEGPPRAR